MNFATGPKPIGPKRTNSAVGLKGETVPGTQSSISPMKAVDANNDHKARSVGLTPIARDMIALTAVNFSR
jgi:hypothetical protein